MIRGKLDRPQTVIIPIETLAMIWSCLRQVVPGSFVFWIYLKINRTLRNVYRATHTGFRMETHHTGLWCACSIQVRCETVRRCPFTFNITGNPGEATSIMWIKYWIRFFFNRPVKMA